MIELKIYTDDEYRANIRKELEEDGLYECVSKRLDEIDTMTSDLLGCRHIQEIICEILDLIEKIVIGYQCIRAVAIESIMD